MRTSPFVLSAVTLHLVAGAGPAALRAQDLPRGGELRQLSSEVVAPYTAATGPMVGLTAGYPYPHPGYYYGTPWFIPQSIKLKRPAPIYAEPRLGLQYLYIHPGNPYGYQFGLQLPPETDEPIWEPVRGLRGFPSPAAQQGIALLRKGLYAEAGRALTRDLREEAAPPELYLLIAEAFFALGKFDDAQIVLRQAIDVAPDLDFLAQTDVPGHFPSREELAKKLQALNAAGNAWPLLRGTILILAGEKEDGLHDLRSILERDAAAKRVYLRFVGAAFGPPEERKPAEEKKPAADKKDEKPGKAEPKAAPEKSEKKESKDKSL